MKNRLFFRFLLSFCAITVLGFLLISLLGPHLIRNDLENHYGTALYKEAVHIASAYDDEDLSKNSASLTESYQNIVALSTYMDSEIWVIDKDGDILLNTADENNENTVTSIENFDPVSLGSSTYTIGDFYGQFSSETLSVLAPVTSNMSTLGYIAIHAPTSTFNAEIIDLLKSMYLLLLISDIMILLIFFLYQRSISKPIGQITQGVKEYAAGNLTYNIPVDNNDEIGYLAATLNYMSDDLAQTEKYQQKFISNVSHDFRSPLTSIKGFIEAIKDGTIPPEMQEHYLDIVLNETERLSKLTESILTLNELESKGSTLSITDFDINAVIHSTAESFGGSCMKKNITIELIMVAEPLYVSADMGRIQQVLYNLIDNAIKFSPTASSIQIESSEKHGKIFVSVKDSGSGISKENIKKIWDRFYKEDSSRGKDRKGTGLGLSIVKDIINAHNQNINVISTEGVGTEFIFTLQKAKNPRYSNTD